MERRKRKLLAPVSKQSGPKVPQLLQRQEMLRRQSSLPVMLLLPGLLRVRCLGRGPTSAAEQSAALLQLLLLTQLRVGERGMARPAADQGTLTQSEAGAELGWARQ